VTLSQPVRACLQGFQSWETEAATTADLHIVEAAPGTYKSGLLIIQAKLLGPAKCLNVVFNANAAEELRTRGAYNSQTFNALGMRALRHNVMKHCNKQAVGAKRGRALGDAGNPLGLTLCKHTHKTLLLFAMMYPPEADDGNARHSLYFRLFGEFVMNTYSAALQRGWSNRIRPGYPDMKNVPALMELARELHLDDGLTKNFGLLDSHSCVRASVLGSGPEQRLATGCSFIAAVHDASLDVLTNKRWRVPTTCDVVSCLKMPGVPESVPLPACSFDEQITGGSSTCPI